MAEAVHLERRAPAVPAGVADGLQVELEPFLGIARLQLWGESAAATDLAADLGVELPPARRACADGDLCIAWMAPNEWLVLGAESRVASLVERAEAFGGKLIMATNLTDACASFGVTGTQARERLSALCPVDVSDAAFPPGGVIRSLLGDANAFILRLADLGSVPAFRVIVDQTLAVYTARMLAEPRERRRP